MWFGIENGFIWFDGCKFEFFNIINIFELGLNWIYGLFFDDMGWFWVVIGVGLVSFDDGKFEVYNVYFDDKLIK